MDQDIVLASNAGPAALAELEQLDEAEREYRKSSKADNTQRAYKAAGAEFEAWAPLTSTLSVPCSRRWASRSTSTKTPLASGSKSSAKWPARVSLAPRRGQIDVEL